MDPAWAKSLRRPAPKPSPCPESKIQVQSQQYTYFYIDTHLQFSGTICFGVHAAARRRGAPPTAR